MAEDVLNKLLASNWETLNAGLLKLTEEQCEELMSREWKGQNRYTVKLRIYGRLNKLRSQRERLEIVKDSKR